jgi:hypothetical protein
MNLILYLAGQKQRVGILSSMSTENEMGTDDDKLVDQFANKKQYVTERTQHEQFSDNAVHNKRGQTLSIFHVTVNSQKLHSSFL